MPLDAAPLPQALAGRYRVDGVLATGGMGRVYRAVDLSLGRAVAIKVNLLEASPNARERFAREAREARAVAALRHPSILEIYDWGPGPDGAYLVTELLEGVDLGTWATDRWATAPATAPERILGALLEVADALQVVHDAGRLHRDLKPASLFVRAVGPAVLLDFGLVRDVDRTRLTATNEIVGTPVFLPPEVLRRHEPTAAGDWYQWGATLFFMCEGRPLLQMHDVSRVARGGALPPVEFRRLDEASPLARVLTATLHPDPAQRLCGPAAIRAILAGGGLHGSAAPRGSPVPSTAPRRRPSSSARTASVRSTTSSGPARSRLGCRRSSKWRAASASPTSTRPSRPRRPRRRAASPCSGGCARPPAPSATGSMPAPGRFGTPPKRTPTPSPESSPR